MRAIYFKAICVVTVLFTTVMTFAQSNLITVTGKVTDADTNNPLIGVTIIEK